MADGYLAEELLDFFGYESAEAFAAICASPETLPIYEPLQMDEDICPACHAVAGEYHELGCPVELCPWCGGQLIHCDCRYEQLGAGFDQFRRGTAAVRGTSGGAGEDSVFPGAASKLCRGRSGECLRVKVLHLSGGRISCRPVWVCKRSRRPWPPTPFFRAKRKGGAASVTSEPSGFPGSGKGPSRRRAPARCSC